MKVAGINDVEGFKVADRARMDVKADRCVVENRRKELVSQIEEWKKTHVNGPAKKLTEELQVIETYLETQTEPVKLAKEKAENEAEEKLKRDKLKN